VRLLVLAGTEDGRELADALKQRGHEVLVSTLTAYGADLAQVQGLNARSGAMDAESLTELLTAGSAVEALVDATHPYAVRVKEMAKKVCGDLGIPYLRWERSALEIADHPLIHWAEDLSSAAQIAAELGQRILLTTGSNGLPEWVSLLDRNNKLLYIRVLPTAEVLKRCEELGFKPFQIIAAQGPFSQAWDEAMFKQLKIEVVVAKESGKVGGTFEKVQACLSLNIPLVIIKRPVVEKNLKNITVTQFIKQMEDNYMKSEIIILGHGSRRAEANQGLLEVAEKVSKLMGQPVTPAYMAHDRPSLPEAVEAKIQGGALRIVVMPLFLFRGIHVTVDIHEELREIREQNPKVEIIFTKELGADDGIANLASLRIKEALGI